MAIGIAGFGINMSWKDDFESGIDHHTMSIQKALHIVAQESTLKLALPNWALHLPIPRIQTMRSAFRELRDYIQEMIAERKAEIHADQQNRDKPASSTKPRRHDLFNNLIEASVMDKGGDDEDDCAKGSAPKVGLSDEELQGNIYIYLLCVTRRYFFALSQVELLFQGWPRNDSTQYGIHICIAGTAPK
jgi:hypothetical protein